MCLSLCKIFRLKAFQLGKLLHQLLYAVLLELYCNLRVVPFAFAAKDHSLAILWMANAHSLAQPSASRRLGDFHLRSRDLLSARAKEARDVIERLARSGRFCSKLRAA